jgi:Family of unknown function (DUF6521)
MSTDSLDAYAATNPAMCSLVLRAFVEGYCAVDSTGVPLSLILVPLPLVYTESLAQTLDSTNVTTGLVSWASRYPQVTVGLAERIESVAEHARNALLFGLRYQILNIGPNGRVMLDATGLKKKPAFPMSTDIGRATGLARRLGAWIGQVQSPETVFIVLGVNR